MRYGLAGLSCMRRTGGVAGIGGPIETRAARSTALRHLNPQLVFESPSLLQTIHMHLQNVESCGRFSELSLDDVLSNVDENGMRSRRST